MDWWNVASFLIAVAALGFTGGRWGWDWRNRRPMLRVLPEGEGKSQFKVDAEDGQNGFLLVLVILNNGSDMATTATMAQLQFIEGSASEPFREAMRSQAPNRSIALVPRREVSKVLNMPLTDYQPHDVLQFPLDLMPHSSRVGFLAFGIPPILVSGKGIPYAISVTTVDGESKPLRCHTKDATPFRKGWYTWVPISVHGGE